MELRPGYKQTEIGVVPDDWEVKKLGDFIALQRGHDLTWRDRRNGDIPVFGAAGQNGFHNKALAKGPGVVLGRSGASFGQAHYCEQDFWPHNTALYVTDFLDNDPRFVFYFLARLDFTRYNSGGAQQSLNRNFISPIIVAVPHPPEQRAIATALSDVDALLEGLERLIAKKRDLKQAAMQQLLTGRTRLPRFGGSWKAKTLGEIATIKDGTHQTPKYVPSGIPFYSVEQVTSLDFTITKYISEREHQFLTRSYKIEKGDILMTRIGSIGDCKLIDWDVNASFYVSLALLKIHPGNSAAYIVHYSKSVSFQNEVDLHSLPSAIPKKINLGPISNIRISLPELDEQIAIASLLTDIDAELAALEQRLAKTLDLKQAMMQELLTGNTRLAVADTVHA